MEKTTKVVVVDDTPFSLLIEEENEIKSVKIVSGKYLCSTKIFTNETEAKKYINKKSWELIMSMFIILKKEMKDE